MKKNTFLLIGECISIFTTSLLIVAAITSKETLTWSSFFARLLMPQYWVGALGGAVAGTAVWALCMRLARKPQS